MTPRTSYVVWFSQRVGSTLLARTLEDTGAAGRPREWLVHDDLLATYGVASAEALRRTLWDEGTTPNGVFALKYSMHAAHHRAIAAVLDEREWDALLPLCRHVIMTRRNRVRLAASWWRAIQTREWHVTPGAPRDTPADLVDRYDRDAIDHQMAEADGAAVPARAPGQMGGTGVVTALARGACVPSSSGCPARP